MRIRRGHAANPRGSVRDEQRRDRLPGPAGLHRSVKQSSRTRQKSSSPEKRWIMCGQQLKRRNMKRFALAVVFGLVILGSAVSLVPQKNATGAGSAPIIVMNTTPIPVTGKVSVDALPAVQIAQNTTLGVSGNVPVVNPLDANGNNVPLLIRDADNGARQPF